MKPSRTHGIQLALLCVVFSGYSVFATDVYTPLDLQNCITAKNSACVIPASVTLNMTSPSIVTLSGSDQIVIQGSENSVIDLTGSTNLLVVYGSGSVVFLNLEIRNGYAPENPFVRLMQPVSLYLSLTHVTLRNMYATSLSGTIRKLGGPIYLNDVNFHNCSSTGANTVSALHLADTTNATLIDLSFISSTSRDQGVIAQAGPVILIEASSIATEVTFGSNIDFYGQDGNYGPHGVLYILATLANVSILSDASSPSVWTIQDYVQPCIRLHATDGYSVQFNAYSLTYSSIYSYSIPYSAIETIGTSTNQAKLNFQSNLSVSSAGLISATIPTSLITSYGSISSYGSAYAISNSAYLFIYAQNIEITDYIHSAISAMAPFTITLQADSTIYRRPLYSSSVPAIKISGTGSCILQIGGSFNISSHTRSTGNGGAIEITKGSTLAIEAVNIFFISNIASAGSGGAIFNNGSLQLSPSVEVRFEGNTAGVNGGALATGPSATSLVVSAGNVNFVSNKASGNGGALYIPASQMNTFLASSFISNSANQSCIIHFSNDECQTLTLPGTIQGNLQNVSSPTCYAMNDLCGGAHEPEFPPAPSPVSCSGNPPSSGSWKCSGGQWISDGSVVGETISIPPSGVIVSGNLTISGNVVFGGHGSSITVIGGCASIDGSLEIELTPSELEVLSKESGSRSLITQSSNCSSLTSLTVNSLKTSKSCRNIKSTTTKDVNNGETTSLIAIFKVSSSSCNTKWIILGCVLGGVLLIILIVVLFVTFNKKAKAFVRPFWGRDKAKRSEHLQ